MTTHTTKKRVVRGPSIANNLGRLGTLRGHIKKPSGKAYPYKNKRY